jgi:Domain of unknown function (DUF1707)
MMDGVGRGFPSGDLRVSDADRDRALSELSEAFRVGRLTADEFDQRSGQALRARTGRELTALLADLPVDDRPAARATVPTSGHHALAVRSVMGASAVAAAGLFLIAMANATVSPGISVKRSSSYFQPGTRLLPFITSNAPRQGRSVRLPLAGGQGHSVRLPSSPVFGWAGTIMPAAIAVLLVLLIIFLHATRADRGPIDRLVADQ